MNVPRGRTLGLGLHATGLAAVGLVLVVLVVGWASRVSDGRRSLEAAEAAFQRGDRVEAIIFARAAAEARCPGCAAPGLGFARLEAIAKDAEYRADLPVAVAAWRAVRAATLATVVIDTSPARRERADAEIARLEHRLDAAGAGGGAGASAGRPASAYPASDVRLRAALAGSTVPSGLVFLLLGLGGALFLFGGVRFVRADGFRTRELVTALAGGGAAAAGLLLF